MLGFVAYSLLEDDDGDDEDDEVEALAVLPAESPLELDLDSELLVEPESVVLSLLFAEPPELELELRESLT